GGDRHGGGVLPGLPRDHRPHRVHRPRRLIRRPKIACRRARPGIRHSMDSHGVAGTTAPPGTWWARSEDRGAEYLLCISGDRSFSVRFPESGELVIGRGLDAGLVVDDPLMSRAHAQLLAMPDGLRLTDLNSRHGTLVNGERITEARIVGSGDVIAVGATLLVVRRPARPSRA